MEIKQRRSNLELLRIVAMLMIIAFHIYRHCVSGQLTDPDSMERMGYVSPFQGSKAREVLITREQFEEKYGKIDE